MDLAAAGPADRSLEDCAKNTLLPPYRTPRKFAVIVQASFALVPVPQGERSNDAPGQSTKLREEFAGSDGVEKNSTWSMNTPSFPLIPLA